MTQFISSYLSPPVSRIILDEKFCMIDNLGPAGDASDVGYAGNAGDAPFGTPVESPVRFPVRITMSCCLFCKSGSISLRVQQREYTLYTNDVLLVFAGQILERVALNSDCRVIFVAVDSEFVLTQLRGKYGYALRDWVLRSKTPTLLHLDEKNALDYERFCTSFKYIIQDAGGDYADGMIYGFTTIFGNLLTFWRQSQDMRIILTDGASEDEGGGNAQKVLLRFRNDVHNFSDKYRDVGYYARRQGLSARHFSRLVKQASGRKCSDIIAEYVVLEAKSLLQTGMYSVHEVARKLGFESDSFFNRFFKNVAGVTPGKYK